MPRQLLSSRRGDARVAPPSPCPATSCVWRSSPYLTVPQVYFPLPPRFPDGGKLTRHMESLKLGDTLKFKGPLGEYVFNPEEAKPGKPLTFSKMGEAKTPFARLGLIAGGSGITPCLQVLSGHLGPPRILADTRGSSRASRLQVATALLQTAQEVEIWLLYANQSPADILCQPELDKIAADPRMHIHYTVDRAGDDWKYSVGFINEAMCRDHLPPPGDSTFVFMCGPPPMLDRACKPNLSKLGHAEQRVHCF